MGSLSMGRGVALVRSCSTGQLEPKDNPNTRKLWSCHTKGTNRKKASDNCYSLPKNWHGGICNIVELWPATAETSQEYFLLRKIDRGLCHMKLLHPRGEIVNLVPCILQCPW